MTDRLAEEGFISFEQAELAGGVDGSPSPLRLTEILGYFGAVSLFIATIALMVDVAISDDFLFGGIDNIPGGLVTLVGTALIGWVGWQFSGSSKGALRRSGGFALGTAFALWVVTVSLLLMDLDVGDFTPVIIVAPMVVAAWFIWDRNQSVPTQLVAFVTVTQVVSALLVLIQVTEYASAQQTIAIGLLTGGLPESQWISSLVAVAVGLAWVWFTNVGLIRPRNTGFAIGALYAGFSAISLFGSADGWIVLFAGITLAVAYAGLAWRSSVLLGIGAVGLIVFISMLMSILLDEMTALQVTIWFGIPGLIALGYAAGSQRTPEAAPEAPPVTSE
jgi:hypothetical protein